MPKITDPDQLNQITEVIFDTTNRTIELIVGGNLSSDGVTLQAIYSFSKEQWLVDPILIKFDFPFDPITTTQFELKFGWNWKDDSTRYLIRDGGWAIKDNLGNSKEEWAGIISLGNLDELDQVYLQQEYNGSKVNFQLSGAVNQSVKIFGDVLNGNFDHRNYIKLFVREWQQTYGIASLSDIGVLTMTYQVYNFPLSNSVDVNVNHDEADISLAPYDNMTIRYYTTNQVRNIGGNNYNFRIIVDGNGQSLEQIYEFVQYKLRQDININSNGTPNINGSTADFLMYFVADLLITRNGVYIDNFNPTEKNNVIFYDFEGNQRKFPFLAGLTISFNSNLSNDLDAKYAVYFVNAGGNLHGTNNAIIVQDSNFENMAGNIMGNSSISHDFDYDFNVQGGRISETDANVIVVASGLNTGQYVATAGVISKSTNNQISVVSVLERNYKNE